MPIKISMDKIICMVPSKSDLASQYIKATTGLEVPPANLKL